MIHFVIPVYIYQAVVWFAAVVGVVAGVVMVVGPQSMVNFQIAVYRSFQWKLEPLNPQREIRNTRWLGLLAVLCGVASSLIQILRSPHP